MTVSFFLHCFNFKPLNLSRVYNKDHHTSTLQCRVTNSTTWNENAIRLRRAKH